MKCNHKKYALNCSFHQNGICTRDHNYECPALVKVVRCKDCMWYEIYELKKDGTDDRRYKPSYCALYEHIQEPDYFCASATRKEKPNDHS